MKTDRTTTIRLLAEQIVSLKGLDTAKAFAKLVYNNPHADPHDLYNQAMGVVARPKIIIPSSTFSIVSK